MKDLIKAYKESKLLLHAYLLVGDTEKVFTQLKSFLEEEVGVKTMGSADFWYGKFDNLNIEGARSITVAQERKDFGGERKIFVIVADFITEEAQNSLLKVFEEPTEGTHFFIISPQEVILPTLRSRVQVILSRESEEQQKSILKLNLSERLAMVKKITDGISDEEKTKQDAISLLNQVEKEIYDKGVKDNHEALRVCEETRISLYDRGALVKIILENLMLNI